MRFRFTMALILTTAASVTAAPPTPQETINESTNVLAELEKIPLKGIPPKLMADAQAVAIIPRVIKVGFVGAARGGHGMILIREKGVWSEPTFVHIGGLSVGLQIGVQATDVVLVFNRKETLEKLISGKDKLTLGTDAAMAAGPLGRQAAAATDGKLQAEIFSYSRSRGLFAGVSIDGAILRRDAEDNASFKDDKSNETAKAVTALKAKLDDLSKESTPPMK